MAYYEDSIKHPCCPDGRVHIYRIENAKKRFWYSRIKRETGGYVRKSTKTSDKNKALKIAEKRFNEILDQETTGISTDGTLYVRKLNMTTPRGTNYIARGIYWIQNIHTGTVYVGMSENISERKRKHLSELARNKHQNSQLQKDWNKWGEWVFQWGYQFYNTATTREAIEKEEMKKINQFLKEGKSVYNNTIAMLIE